MMTDKYRETVARLAPCTCSDRTSVERSLNIHYANCPVELRADIAAALAEAACAGMERAAQIADKYADQPIGEPALQDTLKAFQSGMTYTTGSSDTASAIAADIRAAKEKP